MTIQYVRFKPSSEVGLVKTAREERGGNLWRSVLLRTAAVSLGRTDNLLSCGNCPHLKRWPELHTSPRNESVKPVDFDIFPQA
jgi:hypothetical protein